MGCCYNTNPKIDFSRIKTPQELLDQLTIQINRITLIMHKHIQDSNNVQVRTSRLTHSSELSGNNQNNQNKLLEDSIDLIELNENNNNNAFSQNEYSFYSRIKLACIKIKFDVEVKYIQTQANYNSEYTGMKLSKYDKSVDFVKFKEVLNELFDSEVTLDFAKLENVEEKLKILLSTVLNE